MQFVESWLVKMEGEHPESPIVQAVSQTTKTGQLDEAGLLRKLRELAKPLAKEKRNDLR